MRKKKNRFLLFIFSWIPGAGEMYLGFMKMGVSLLGIFVLLIMIAAYLDIGILALPIIVVYAFSFFHANNLGSLSDEEFYKIQDKFLFGIDEKEVSSLKSNMVGRYRRVLAIILICLGIATLWQTMDDFLRHFLGDDFYYRYIHGSMRMIGNEAPRFVIGFVIVWLGIKLIQGKKVELDKLEENEAQETQETQTDRAQEEIKNE